MNDDQARRLEEIDRVRQHRDFQMSDGLHPLTRGWAQYHKGEQPIPIRNPDGRLVLLTPTQYRVWLATKQLEGRKVSATIIAASLGVAVSTVTRGLVILAMLKLVAYDVEHGRGGGFTFLSMAWADLKRRSRTAWTKVQSEKSKAWDRFQNKLERSHYFTAGLNFATSNEVVANFSPGAS